MTTVLAKERIHSTVQSVFKAISDIENLPETNPDIVKIEFLTNQKTGIGTRFIETRLMNGREAHTELEITELDENKSIRMLADSHGTVWDSLFSVNEAGNNTEITIKMDARAHKLLPKILNPLMKSLFRKGLVKHLLAVKTYCESHKK